MLCFVLFCFVLINWVILNFLLSGSVKNIGDSFKTRFSHFFCQEEMRIRKELYGKMVVSEHQYQDIYRTTGLDIDNRKEMMDFHVRNSEKWIRGYITFAKQVPGFRDLSPRDQANLVKCELSMLSWSLCWSVCLPACLVACGCDGDSLKGIPGKDVPVDGNRFAIPPVTMLLYPPPP